MNIQIRDMSVSPYLKHENRLAEVIAAIQVMGKYRFYKLDFSKWADRISGDEKEAIRWQNVFIEHPEFFRIDQTKKKASLVWRRNLPKDYNVDSRSEITREDFMALSDNEKARISRRPLNNEDICMLIESAINLHTRALQHKQDRRWWIPLTIGLVTGIIPFVIDKILEGI